MNNLKFKKNDLLIEGVSIKKLSKKFETPFYCYSTSTIIEKFREFEKPFKYLDTIICYAVKANPNIAILKILSKLGAGAEVVSEGELRRSLKANIPAKKIVFSGVGKSLKEIEFAIKKNILQINVESEEELKLYDDSLYNPDNLGLLANSEEKFAKLSSSSSILCHVLLLRVNQ